MTMFGGDLKSIEHMSTWQKHYSRSIGQQKIRQKLKKKETVNTRFCMVHLTSGHVHDESIKKMHYLLSFFNHK